MTSTHQIDRPTALNITVSSDGRDMSAEASELGLRPGEWPEAIELPGSHTLTRHTCRRREGEILFVRYINGPQSLVVFND